ncbi:MAG: phage holin family protein [Gemmatimonadaceae bacterium]|nr:phage holin family protein [Gemmatimonadaceae bacterium]
MSNSPRASQTLLGAMRELVTQSERVAKAEARVMASRLGDVARVGSRRVILVASALMLAGAAVSFLLVAAYVVLAARMTNWYAALIVAGGTTCLAVLCGWAAASAPSGTSLLVPDDMSSADNS